MIKTVLTQDERRAMIEAAPCLRDKVIVTFLDDTGCRISELLSLTPEHLDLKNMTVLIPHLKRGVKKQCPSCGRIAGRKTAFCPSCGNDLRMVPTHGIEERSRLISIGPATTEILTEYLKEVKEGESLFKLTRQRVNQILVELAEKTGLKGKCLINPETGKKHRVHPHSFRSSLATDWLGVAGEDITMQKALQEHLGHKHFDTTVGYHKLAITQVHRIRDEIRKQVNDNRET